MIAVLSGLALDLAHLFTSEPRICINGRIRMPVHLKPILRAEVLDKVRVSAQAKIY
jgi:hypothetical protein